MFNFAEENVLTLGARRLQVGHTPQGHANIDMCCRRQSGRQRQRLKGRSVALRTALSSSLCLCL